MLKNSPKPNPSSWKMKTSSRPLVLSSSSMLLTSLQMLNTGGPLWLPSFSPNPSRLAFRTFPSTTRVLSHHLPASKLQAAEPLIRDQHKGEAPMDRTVNPEVTPSAPKLMGDSITALQTQAQRAHRVTGTTRSPINERETRAKKRQEPSVASLPEANLNEWDIPLSRILGQATQNPPDQLYQRKSRRILISTAADDEETPTNSPKTTNQTHIPSSSNEPNIPTPNQPTPPSLSEPPPIYSRDITLGSFLMKALYLGETVPINFLLVFFHPSTSDSTNSQTSIM